MTEERYKQLMEWGRAHEGIRKCLCFLNKCLPIALAALYVLFLLGTVFIYPVYLLDLMLRPFLCFTFITIVRKIINRPRPYDVYHTAPMGSYTAGKNESFPSRHTGSAAIIALEIFRIAPEIGSICIFAALIIGGLRVICGNHFIKDVVAAFIVSALFYLVF